jgi:hypothetical protein
MSNKLRSFSTQLFGIRYRSGSQVWDPRVQRYVFNGTQWSVGGVTAVALIGALYAPFISKERLEQFGAFIRTTHTPPNPPPMEGLTGGVTRAEAPPANETTELVFILSNLGCDDLDLTKSINEIKKLNFVDDNNQKLTVEPYLEQRSFESEELVTLLQFRKDLHNCDLLNQQTLVALNASMKDSAMKKLLDSCNATTSGDETGGANVDDPNKWGTALIDRITTGGPNGSMAGKIAVDFMDHVAVPSFFAERLKADAFARFDTSDPAVAIIHDAVNTAANSTAKGLTDYLAEKTASRVSRDDNNADRQTATVVKGIKDSMPATGKTVAQLAVYNALGHDDIAKLPQEEQLRVAYTVANSTRAAVEATGNHVADLYQADEIPTEEELKAIGARGLSDFLGSVAKTVTNGVMQAAPVVLNSVANSIAANNQLGSNLPPSIMLACLEGVQKLDAPTKVTLASRIVNGKSNADANVITDKAVMDLATRTSELAAQATLDTFNNVVAPQAGRDDPENREKFKDIALAVSTLSPTLSNVTDIGATNLVTEDTLKHSDSLRQNALEIGMRSSANMIADNPTATMLFMVHQHRLKNGRDVKPRGFGDFLSSVIPIAANIASTAVPALMSII